MGTKIKRFFKKIRIKRTTVLVLVFVFMSATLVRQLFELQIIQGEAYISKFESRTTQKRVIKSTRGNIYDRNGEELATNVLAYSVTFEDNGTYDSTREKNLTLNGIAYKVLKILESNGDSISTGFHIVLDESGNYTFDVDEGFTLNRFRADIYGEPLIDNLTKKQKNATADQMIEFDSYPSYILSAYYSIPPFLSVPPAPPAVCGYVSPNLSLRISLLSSNASSDCHTTRSCPGHRLPALLFPHLSGYLNSPPRKSQYSPAPHCASLQYHIFLRFS